MRAKLGYTYKSKVSGRTGIAVFRAEYLDGGVIVGLTSFLGDGTNHVPETLLEPVDEPPVRPHAREEIGLD